MPIEDAVGTMADLVREGVADGRVGTPALFNVNGDDVGPRRLALEGVERRADDVLWLRYRVGPQAGSREPDARVEISSDAGSAPR